MKNDSFTSLTIQQFVLLMNRTGLCSVNANTVYALKQEADVSFGGRGKVNIFKVCAYLRRRVVEDKASPERLELKEIERLLALEKLKEMRMKVATREGKLVDLRWTVDSFAKPADVLRRGLERIGKQFGCYNELAEELDKAVASISKILDRAEVEE